MASRLEHCTHFSDRFLLERIKNSPGASTLVNPAQYVSETNIPMSIDKCPDAFSKARVWSILDRMYRDINSY